MSRVGRSHASPRSQGARLGAFAVVRDAHADAGLSAISEPWPPGRQNCRLRNSLKRGWNAIQRDRDEFTRRRLDLILVNSTVASYLVSRLARKVRQIRNTRRSAHICGSKEA